jgi:thiol-disulfide isomerase/thioredoxin
MGDTSQSEKNFAASRVRKLYEELELMRSFISLHKITDPKYTQWAKNHLMYSAGFDIAFFPFAGKRNHEITYEGLVNLLGPIKIHNDSASVNSNYYSFLNLLCGDFEIIANLNSKFEQQIKQLGNSTMLFILDQVDQFASGKAKQLMYYNIYLRNFQRRNNACEENIFRFESGISDRELKALFSKARERKRDLFQPYNVVEKLAAHPLGDSISAIFSRIIAQNPDKYLYLDFWGSWCAPCMHEMPLYQQLIRDLRSQPITFIFFAVGTDERQMQEIKAKFNIDGEFVCLNGNDSKIFNNVLEFSSYPSHFIISPSGLLVNNSIGGLNSGADVIKRVEDQITRVVSDHY